MSWPRAETGEAALPARRRRARSRDRIRPAPPENAPDVAPPPYDPAAAGSSSTRRGSKPGPDGIRRRGGKTVSFEFLYTTVVSDLPQPRRDPHGRLREGRRGHRPAPARLGGAIRSAPRRGVRRDAFGNTPSPAAPRSLHAFPFEPGSSRRAEHGLLQEPRGRPPDRGARGARWTRPSGSSSTVRSTACSPPTRPPISCGARTSTGASRGGSTASRSRRSGLFHFLPGPLGWRLRAARRQQSPAWPRPLRRHPRPRPVAGPRGSLLHDAARAISARGSSRSSIPTGRRHPRLGRRLDDPESGLAAYYLSINRNKESIALDLATEEGRGIGPDPRRAGRRPRRELPAGRPGEIRPLARGDARENPRLVTASITGFGRTGPDASAPGFDLLAQAGAGLMAITGEPDGGPTKSRRRGLRPASPAATSRSESRRPWPAGSGPGAGRTSRPTSSPRRSPRSSTSPQAALVTGEEAGRHGNAHPQIVPYRTFSASDGDFVVAVGTDPQFARLAAARRPSGVGGGPAVSHEPGARREPRGELEALLDEIFRARAARRLARRACRDGGGPGRPRSRPARSAAIRDRARPGLGPDFPRRLVRRVADPAWTATRRRSRFPPALDADGERLRREFGLPD